MSDDQNFLPLAIVCMCPFPRDVPKNSISLTLTSISHFFIYSSLKQKVIDILFKVKS